MPLLDKLMLKLNIWRAVCLAKILKTANKNRYSTLEVLTSHFKYCENSLSALSYSDQCCDDGCQVLVGGHPRLLEDLHGIEDDGEGSGEEGEVEAGEDDEEGGPD